MPWGRGDRILKGQDAQPTPDWRWRGLWRLKFGGAVARASPGGWSAKETRGFGCAAPMPCAVPTRAALELLPQVRTARSTPWQRPLPHTVDRTIDRWLNRQFNFRCANGAGPSLDRTQRRFIPSAAIGRFRGKPGGSSIGMLADELSSRGETGLCRRPGLRFSAVRGISNNLGLVDGRRHRRRLMSFA